jgi:outer membrane lipopolysaccharide assembly protein LptE/RlpB
MATSFIRCCAAVVTVMLLFGCGYHLSAGGEYIDKGLKTVYVAPFTNKTSEANIENTFRAAFMDWFIKGNRFKIVDQADQADTIWRGTIQSLMTTTLSYQTSNVAAEERMTVVLDLKFEERESRKEIWADKAFSAFQDYRITDVMNTDSARKNALSRLSAYAAEGAYRMMMSGF